MSSIPLDRDAPFDDPPRSDDPAIAAAHPMRTGRHDLWAEAMRLVSERHAKYDLVELVNWLLAENAEQRAALIKAETFARRVSLRHDNLPKWADEARALADYLETLV